MPAMASVSVTALFARDNAACESKFAMPGSMVTASEVQHFLSRQQGLEQGSWVVCDENMKTVAPGVQVSAKCP